MPFDSSEPSPLKGVPNSSWPTNKQLAAIGAVVNVWSWLDLSVQTMLCALVQADSFLSQALTEDLSPDNRIKALKRLADTWEQALINPSEEEIRFLQEIRGICAWISTHKARRNQVAHYIWFRDTDERVFGWKYHVKRVDEQKRLQTTMTPDDLWKFCRETGAIVDRLSAARAVAEKLKEWPKHRRTGAE